MIGGRLIWLAPVITAAILLALMYHSGNEKAAPDSHPGFAAPVNCDPQASPCLSGGRQRGIALSLPQSVPVMAPFPVQVQVFGPQASSVTINFEMRGMDMGMNRTELEEAEPGIWRGRATLPVCVSGRADWLARIEVETASGTRRATFGFAAGVE